MRSMSSVPLVSVGLPTYNRSARLERALKYVLAQDYGNIEVVVSDNGSTDGTAELCSRLLKEDRRLKYIRQAVNIGPTANYRAVLEGATGEYYMALADDDWLSPNYIGECLEELRSDSSTISVVGVPHMYDGERFLRTGGQTMIMEASPVDRVVSYYRTVVENSGFHGLTRRAVLMALPAMPNTMGGDWVWMASIAYTGKIKTNTRASILKQEGGASVTWARIASVLNLPSWQARYGWEAIVLAAIQDIARSPVYAELGPAGRLSLASTVALTLARKWRMWERWPFYARRAVSEAVRGAIRRPKV
jgi:glycosyltransferase involved in cell wall biosynthesis